MGDGGGDHSGGGGWQLDTRCWDSGNFIVRNVKYSGGRDKECKGVVG